MPWPTVLASASPRRFELLGRLVREFEIDTADLDEEAFVVPDPVVTAERLALAKALAVSERQPGKLVIGGDTVVELEGRQFAKPVSLDDAVDMLLALSGHAHRVISAVALVWPGGSRVFSETARVRFRVISRAEARAYVETGEPMDKAGGYAIQGGAAPFVTSLEGEMETVIGLPVTRLAAELRALADEAKGHA